jgi:sugar phosphate isomerase/epimerase
MGLNISRFLLGMGEGGSFPTSAKAISEWFPAKERAFAFGVFNTGSGVGAVIAPPLIAFIILSLNWRWAFIDLAADFGGIVNIGRVRGLIGKRSRSYVEELFVEAARELCEYALLKNVCLILEPVNRYEIDFINTVEEGAKLMKKVGMPNMRLMPDLFHMNIEDNNIGGELAGNMEFIKYIHIADSNRLAPGWGHTDFPLVFKALLYAGYDGWLSAEILPRPDPDSAALQTIEFLTPLIRDYNEKLMKVI